jgi:hypothetical protein
MWPGKRGFPLFQPNKSLKHPLQQQAQARFDLTVCKLTSGKKLLVHACSITLVLLMYTSGSTYL